MLSDSIFGKRMQGMLLSLVLLAFVAGCSTRVVRDGGKVTVLSEEGTPLEDAKVTVGFKQHLFFPALSGVFDAEVARTDHRGRAKIKELTKRKPFEPFNLIDVDFRQPARIEWISAMREGYLPFHSDFGSRDRDAPAPDVWDSYPNLKIHMKPLEHAQAEAESLRPGQKKGAAEAEAVEYKKEWFLKWTLAFDLGGGETLEMVWVEALNGWVGKYEVTNGQYRRFKKGHNSGEFKGDSLNGNEQPVVEVSFNDAEKFAEWLNDQFHRELPGAYRFGLPDREAWMTYARCGDGRKYPWGDDWPPKYGNYADIHAKGKLNSIIGGYDDGQAVTASVAKSGRNDWGLYGVGGNVWEWTTETSGPYYLVRGASWDGGSEGNLRFERKVSARPSSHDINTGFRVLLFP